jgi:hypothetical protein
MGAPKFLLLRRIAFIAALAAGPCCVHAQDAKGQAFQAAVADGLSSAAVLATGAVSLNPLAPVLSFGLNVATLQYAESLPENERPAAYASASAVWSGTTANNLCITVAFLATGGGLLPVCMAVGVAWGVKTWNEGEQGRFRQVCAALREFAQPPNFECIEPAAPPEQAAKAPHSFSAADLTAQ